METEEKEWVNRDKEMGDRSRWIEIEGKMSKVYNNDIYVKIIGGDERMMKGGIKSRRVIAGERGVKEESIDNENIIMGEKDIVIFSRILFREIGENVEELFSGIEERDLRDKISLGRYFDNNV